MKRKRGGGQEINTSEAGISGWLDGVRKFFPGWAVIISLQRGFPITSFAEPFSVSTMTAGDEVNPEMDLCPHCADAVQEGGTSSRGFSPPLRYPKIFGRRQCAAS